MSAAIGASMPRKKKVTKHPREMTTDELVRHLFHPKVVAHLKRAAQEGRKPGRKK